MVVSPDVLLLSLWPWLKNNNSNNNNTLVVNKSEVFVCSPCGAACLHWPYLFNSIVHILCEVYIDSDICFFCRCLWSENTTWTCTVCTFLNHEALEVCEMCEMPRNRAVEARAWIDWERTNHGLAHFDRIKVSVLELHHKLWTIQHKRRLLKNFKRRRDSGYCCKQ